MMLTPDEVAGRRGLLEMGDRDAACAIRSGQLDRQTAAYFRNRRILWDAGVELDPPAISWARWRWGT